MFEMFFLAKDRFSVDFGGPYECLGASRHVPGAIRFFIDLRLGVKTVLDLPPEGSREAPGRPQAPPRHLPGTSWAPFYVDFASIFQVNFHTTLSEIRRFCDWHFRFGGAFSLERFVFCT